MSEKSRQADTPTSEELDKVACDTCLTEIPKSVAMSSEADEYTQYFCGTECYTKWRSEDNSDNTPEPSTVTRHKEK